MRRTAAAVATVLALGACSAGRAMTASAAQQLQNDVAAVRDAALRGDRAGAESGLAHLRRAVAQLEGQHQLSTAKGAAILTSAADVEAQLSAIPLPTTTTAPPPDTVVVVAPPGHHGKPQDNQGGD